MYIIVQSNGRIAKSVASATDNRQDVVNKVLAQHPGAVVRHVSDDRTVIWPSQAAAAADSGNGEMALCEIRRLPDPPTET